MRVVHSIERRPGGDYLVQPSGWVVRGVIAPCDVPGRFKPAGLACCDEGLVVVARSMAGIWSAGISAGFGTPTAIAADTMAEFAPLVSPGPGEQFTRAELAALYIRWRLWMLELRVALSDGRARRYGILARRAAQDYRTLLRSLYADVYQEEGFDSRWARWLD